MEARNPYSVSSASFKQHDDIALANSTDSVWRDGKLLVMRPGAALPHRCVKCNEPCELPMQPRAVYWHHWSVYLLLLVFVPLFIIVALVARRKAMVAAGLCRKHREHRFFALILMWLGIALGVAASFKFGGTGGLIVLAAIIIGLIASRTVRAKHINSTYVRLKGCAPEFLDSLPPFKT